MNLPIKLILSELPEELKEIALANRFNYIAGKAYLFLRLGTEKYRENDFFEEPDEHLDPEVIEVIKSGCRQIIKGKGLTESDPLTEIDVVGFSSLMRMFHYEQKTRSTKHSVIVDGKKGALDRIILKHFFEDSEIRYYNFCEYEAF